MFDIFISTISNVNYICLIFLLYAYCLIYLMSFEMKLGERITEYIDKFGTNQRQLALKAGISPEYLSQIISGHAENVGIKKIEAIAEALGIHPNELLYGKIRSSNTIQETDIEPIKLPLLSGTVSAGTFIHSFSDWEGERVAMPIQNSKNKVVWRIQGDSMSPEYEDGDLVLIDHSVRFSDGDDVIAENHKGVTIKQIKLLKNGSIELRPRNPNYSTIHIDKDQDLMILGVVTGCFKFKNKKK